MTKQYKVLVNTGKAETKQTIDIQQGAGDKGQPVRIKAQAGAKYELQELGRKKPVGPDYVKVTPTANASGSATISVANSTFSDAGGNTNRDTGTNPAPTGATFEANNLISAPFNTDTTAPTVIVTRTSGATSTVTGAESITFTFSEAINPASFDASDIDAVGGAMGNLQPDPSSGSAATGYTRYTATYTPTSGTSGSGSVGVLASKFTDMAGNANTDSYALTGAENTNNQVAFQVNTSAPDTTAPTIAITRAGAGTVTGTEVIYFTLSEASTTFTSGDIDVSGGSLSGFAQSATNPLLYSATFTPTPNATGNATIGVAAGKFQDAANNQNLDTYSGAPTAVTGQVVESNNQLTLAYNTDTTAPTIVVGRQGSGTVTGPITVTFTLSEASTDFSLADMDAVGGTLSNLQGSGTSYTATFTPTANAVGTASVGVASSKFTDAAGNFNLDTYLTGITGTTSEGAGTPGANIVVFQYATDATPPTIAITSDKTTLTSGQTATITFTLSEASSNFTLADIDATGGSLGTLTQSSTDPKVYTAVFTPTAGGTGNATIGVLSGKFSDAAGNNNVDTYANPATAPAVNEANNQVSIGLNLTNNSTATIDIVSATTDSGASASDFITNDQTLTYAGTITGWVPGLGDRVMLQFYDSNGQQMGSNAFVAPAANGAWTWDDTANIRAAGTYSLKATIVSASGTTAINSTAPTSVSGNLTQGGYDQQTVVIDTAAPPPSEINLAVSITTDADNNTYVNKAELASATTFTSRATFNTALAKAGMVITLSDGTTSTPITLTDTMVTAGYVETTFAKPAEGAVQTVTAKLTDLAGNVGTQTVSDSATLDTTAITVAVSRTSTTDATLIAGSTEVITFTLSEASSDFTWDGSAGDITVTGGTLGALTQSSSDPKVYTATFTPAVSSTGTATIGVLSGKFSDAAGNNNEDTYESAATAPAVYESNNQVSLAYNTRGNSVATIDIVSATTDSGASASDFITNDQTLTYAGTITGWVPGLGDRVMLQFLDSSGQQIGSNAFVAPAANGAWTWDDTANTRAAGTYSLKATIVSATGTTAINTAAPTSVSGNLTQGGYDQQTVVIDTAGGTTAEINLAISIITDADNNAFVNKAELSSNTTFTSRVTFDPALAKPGMVITISDGTTTTPITLTPADVASGFVLASFTKPAEGATQTVTAKLTDLAGNVGTQTVSDSATLDTTAITVAVSRALINGVATNATLGVGGSEVITFTLSEASSNFAWNDTTQIGDITVTGGTLGALTQSSTNTLVYTATFTPAANTTGTAKIGVLAGKFSDAALNNNLDTYTNPATAPEVNETNNQVSVLYDTLPPAQVVSFSSMTKDSGVTTTSTINSNWLTNDTSAGRLVSGFLSAPLGAGEVVNVYVGGTLIGAATVSPGGTTWEITDLNGYGSNASWTYTAKVVDATGNAGTTATQLVNTDLTEAAPTITGVFDTASSTTSIAHNGTTTNALSSVKGTAGGGAAAVGSTIYLYDNNYTTLVGTAVVDSSGNWSVTSLSGTFGGSNTFAAKQVDAQGNQSGLSNQWTVSLPNTNIVANGDFSNGSTGFTTFGSLMTNQVSYDSTDNYIVGDIKGMVGSKANTLINADDIAGYTGAPDALTRSTTNTSGQVSWYTDYLDLVDGGVGSVARQRVGRTFESLAGTVGESNDVLTGNVWTSNGGTLHTILSTTVNVEAGKTYTFSYDYLTSFWSGNPWGANVGTGGRLAAVVDGVSMEVPYTLFNNDAEITTGTVTATYTATATKAITIKFTGKGTDSNSYGDYALDNISFVESGASAAVSTFGTAGPTANPDTLSYTAGALDAMASNDIITVGNTSLQATLTAGGIINGGAGIDNLKLAAGTTLNLESLTGNQTVRPIEQVEMITLQGGTSVLTMSANDVLSLGGSNAPTMEPYTFTSTTQVATSGGVQATGSTTSTGKVQFVVNGQLNDVLNLSVLANDGVVSTNGASAGLLGNTDLAGSWAYKGTFSIAAGDAVDGVAHVYKVYDHSTTGAQVLVDVDVTVNTITPITISAISTDAGTSGTDFVTNDQTLTYSGGLPAAFNGATERVLVEILNSSNVVVSTGFATPNGTTWSWNNETVSEAAGNYTIRATIVGQGNTTPVAAYGAGVSTTHQMTIDLTPPQVAISRTDGLTTTVGSAGTQVTFTLSEASSDFTWSGTAGDIEVSGGTLSALVQSSTNPLVYTATFTPDANAAGTGYVRIASSKFMDAAGNNNVDTYVTGANYQANNLQEIPYDTLPPTQTVAFSSMTKDSGVTADAAINSNWTTNDTSAGRLLSGTLSAPLDAGDVVKVYANGTLIGTATVAPGGKTWEITDTSGYSAGWTYTAQVVDSQNATGTMATQVVNADLTEAPPVITGVFDTASSTTTIANNGTTTNALSTVKGTGVAGDTIYLYDNNYTTMVGSAVVDGSGNWSVTALAGTFGGSNTFAAKQVDAQGNQSALSNQWTVTVPATALNANSGFSSGMVDYTTKVKPIVITTPSNGTDDTAYIWGGNRIGVIDLQSYYQPNYSTTNPAPGASGALPIQVGSGALSAATTPATWSNGTWTQKTYTFGSGSDLYTAAWKTFASMASGKILAGSADGILGNNGSASSASNLGDLWRSSVSVVAGKTYEFSFAYWNTVAKNLNTAGFMDVMIDGQKAMTTTNNTTGKVSITYTATTTGSIDLALQTWSNQNSADFVLDNLVFAEAAPPNTLGTAGPTANPDTLSYTAGALDALDSNDTITVTSTGLQATLAAGGMIDGGAGVDTLKLAAGTTLNLDALNGNQTVKPIQEVEIIQMQGASSLTLSANDVLSLGGSNASTMAGYTFSTTTGGTASASSTGKVQMVITGTASDTLVLDPLMKDGVTTNGVEGNTALAGQWNDMGTTVIGGVTYKVYNHSTTQAQVLTTITPTVRSNDIAFSSMTKDSGVTADASINSNWITNDASAGRLISGTVATPLAAGDVVNVYANGTLIGPATVNAAGTAWEITDTAGYNASWVYSANIVSASGTSTTAYQPVNADLTEAPPVITGVFDTASSTTTIANNGTTTKALSSVKGTGVAGDTIYLYDNSINTLVGTAVVDSSGNWAVPITGPFTYSSNTFSAKQVDAQGNQSVLSNLWTVTAPAANVLDNGDFSNGNTGFTSTVAYDSTISFGTTVAANKYNITSNIAPLTARATTSTTSGITGGINWTASHCSSSSATNPDGAFTGQVLVAQLGGGGIQTLWADTVSVVAGQDYKFSFDYFHGTMAVQTLKAIIDGTTVTFTSATLDAGRFTGIYRATATKDINLSITGGSNNPSNSGDAALDNIKFTNATTTGVTDGSLVAGGTGTATPNPDILVYTGAALDALAGNDTITATSSDLQATLAAGGMLDGGAGMDTLKLAPGTTLNLDALNGNQTVRPIQEVEIIQMQGASSLTLSANDVLSLGGSNASTMGGYTFSTTTGGTASASSNGKVQMVITGTASDTLALVPLMKDGVTTNSIQGNTGLAGQWDDMGTTVIGGVTYKVYNHSTTQAQVLTTISASLRSNDIAFSSMTKDSGLAGYTANWVTADGSAGRLISGTVATPLAAGDVVNVYANGTLIGPATLNSARTAWEITDTAGYNASWVYSANIVSASGTSTTATQPVTADFVATAPTITSVHDSANVAVGATGTNAANANPTSNALSSVSGTAPVSAMGSVIYLYDNSTTNLVGSAVVDSSGNWTVTGLSVSTATNSFAAVMLDVNGKQSPLSNLWTVNTSASGIVNGDFSDDLAGFTSDVGLVNQTNPAAYERSSYIFGGNRYSVVDLYNARMGDTPTNATIPGGSNWATGTYPATGTLTESATQNWASGTWSQKTYIAPDANYGFTTAWGTFFNLVRDGVRPGTVSGAPDGRILMGSADGIFAADTGLPSSAANPGRLWASQVSVVKGQTYEFSFDYWNSESKDRATPGFMDVVIDGQVAMSTTNNSAGEVTVKYVANKTGLIDLSLNTWSTYNAADYALDNIAFRQVAPADGSLLPGGTPPATPNPDALDYTGGPLDALEGNDVMTLTATDVSGMFSGGGYINGGAGVDTLKLAAGTTLNLDALTRNQTVQPIQQVEVFQLQGASNLTLTANDVLSLGGANATTMSGYTFTTTSGGTGSASSTGKVQFVVNGTSTDTVTLATLTNDGVTTNGTLGNTGLAGNWADMGTTAIGGVTYKVYNHSTTQAQVLVAGATTSTPANSQSIAITHANNSNASGTYTEEFGISGSTAVNTVTNTVDTAAWTITAKDLMTGKALVSELKLTTGSAGGSYASYTDPAMGTDAKLVLGNAASTNANEPRLNTFTSKAGEFTAIAFNYLELNYAYANNTNGGALVKFYNADGVVIHSTLLTATSLSTLGLFNYSLPAGMTASSFSIQTNTNDQWFMDGLKMTPAASTDLPHTSATLDSSPLLSGTYVSELNAGDVIKVYDGSTLVGTAMVDAASKTWTLQLPTGQSVGSHTYVAKVVSSANADVATSNNFTLNVLSGALPPVVMDLNLDGVLDYSQVQMDLNGDGALDTTAWVGSQDGLLVHDVHGDGSVRSTSQFAFARHAGETDLQGLAAQFDSNQDGVFNAQDAQFGEMAVWQDADQDGVADAGEVKHLIDLGITEIALVSDGVVRTPAEGVTEAGQSSAQLANGSSMLVSDAAFAYQLNASQVTLDLTVEPTPDDEVTAFKLNVADVMATPADANGQHVVQVKGDGNDTLNLSNLLGEEAPGQWLAAGTVQQGGVMFNTYNYSADTSLQVMVDQHLQNVTLS